MRLKPKRRIILIVSSLLVLAVGAFSLVVVRNWQKQRITDEFFAKGQAAFKAGDLYTSLFNNGQYLARVRTDAEARSKPRHVDALLAYAESRRLIEEPDFHNLYDSITWYKQYLDRREDPVVTLTLLKVYNQYGLFVEAKDLARKALPADLANAQAKDVPVLREECMALVESRSFTPTATEKKSRVDQVLDRLLELEPFDPTANMARFRVNAETNRQAESQAWVDQLLAKNPGDARAFLIAGWQQRLENKAENLKPARENFCRAANIDPDSRKSNGPGTLKDEASLLSLLDGLKGLGEFDCEWLVLADAANRVSIPAIERQYLRRLWQDGDFAEVVRRTDSLDPKSRESNSEALAFRAISLIRLNKPDEALAIAAVLEHREGDYRAGAWAHAIPLYAKMVATGWTATSDVADDWKGVAKACPSEPFFFYCYGESLAGIGQDDAALQAWRDCFKYPVALSWYYPRVRIVEILVRSGRAVEAAEAADETLRYAPTRALANVVWLEAHAARLQTGAPGGYSPAQLAVLCDEAMRQFAQKSQEQAAVDLRERLIVPHVLFLAMANQKEDAIAAAKEAINADPPVKPVTLQRLAAVSAKEKLGVEDLAMRRVEALAGETTSVKFVRAIGLFRAGKRDDGAKLMRSAAEAAPKDWEVQAALARFLEQTQSPEALAAWISLGDGFPATLDAQIACLNSEVCAGDPAFVERTLKRYAALTGREPGPTDAVPTIAQARALLAAMPASKANRDKAIALLSALVSAHPKNVAAKRSLAAALASSQVPGETDLPRATALLSEAAALEPSDSVVAIELANVLKLQGQFEKAKDQLYRVAKDKDRSDEARRVAARLLVEQGDRGDVATETLKDLRQRSGPAPDPELLTTLAESYTLQGKDADAERIYGELAAGAATDANSIYLTVRYFNAHGMPDRAKPLLERMQSLDLPASDKDYLIASLAGEQGDTAAMVAGFERAVTAAPKTAQYWRQYVLMLLKRQKLDEALAVIERAEKSVPDDSELSLYKAQAQMLKAGTGETDISKFKQALAADPKYTQVKAIVDAVEEADKKKELNSVEGLVRLADRFPNHAPLQILIARSIAIYDPTRTTVLLTRAMAANPTDPNTARDAAEIYLNTGRFQEMLAAAMEWRQRDRTRSVEADVAVAQAYLGLKQIDKGLETLTPRVEAAKKSTSEITAMSVLNIQARLLLAANREPEARALLAPTLTRSSEWRIAVWLRIAVEATPTLDLARAWLVQLRNAIPPDAVEEIGICTAAKSTLAQRFPQYAKQIQAETLADLQKLAESPSTATAFVFENIGMTYHATGDLPNAEKAYSRALELDRNRGTCLNNLANILFENGKLEAALDLAKRAVELGKDNPNPNYVDTLAEVYKNLSIAAESAGDSAGVKSNALLAAQNFQRASDLQYGSAPQILGAAGMYERAGQMDKAAECYEVLMKARLDPKLHAQVKNNLAMAIVRSGDTSKLERAAALINEAIQLFPHPAFFDTLGWIELDRGRPQQAIDAFTKSIQLNETEKKADFPSPRIGRAIALLQVSDAGRTEAKGVLDSLAKVKLDADEAKRLEQLRKLVESGPARP